MLGWPPQEEVGRFTFGTPQQRSLRSATQRNCCGAALVGIAPEGAAGGHIADSACFRYFSRMFRVSCNILQRPYLSVIFAFTQLP